MKSDLATFDNSGFCLGPGVRALGCRKKNASSPARTRLLLQVHAALSRERTQQARLSALADQMRWLGKFFVWLRERTRRLEHLTLKKNTPCFEKRLVVRREHHTDQPREGAREEYPAAFAKQQQHDLCGVCPFLVSGPEKVHEVPRARPRETKFPKPCFGRSQPTRYVD